MPSHPRYEPPTDNVGAALEISQRLGTDGAGIADAARVAFVDSMAGSLWVGVGFAVLATALAWTKLPRRAEAPTRPDQGGDVATADDLVVVR